VKYFLKFTIFFPVRMIKTNSEDFPSFSKLISNLDPATANMAMFFYQQLNKYESADPHFYLKIKNL